MNLRRIRIPGNRFAQEDESGIAAVAQDQVGMADQVVFIAVIGDFHDGRGGIHKAFRNVVPVQGAGRAEILMGQLFKSDFHVRYSRKSLITDRL